MGSLSFSLATFLFVVSSTYATDYIWLSKSMDYFSLENCTSLDKSTITGNFKQCMEKPPNPMESGVTTTDSSTSDEWPATMSKDFKRVVNCLDEVIAMECLTESEKKFFETTQKLFEAEAAFIDERAAKVAQDLQTSSCKYKQNIDTSTQCFSKIHNKYPWLTWSPNYEDGVICDYLDELKDCEVDSYKLCTNGIAEFMAGYWKAGIDATPCKDHTPKPRGNPFTKQYDFSAWLGSVRKTNFTFNSTKPGSRVNVSTSNLLTRAKRSPTDERQNWNHGNWAHGNWNWHENHNDNHKERQQKRKSEDETIMNTGSNGTLSSNATVGTKNAVVKQNESSSEPKILFEAVSFRQWSSNKSNETSSKKRDALPVSEIMERPSIINSDFDEEEDDDNDSYEDEEDASIPLNRYHRTRPSHDYEYLRPKLEPRRSNWYEEILRRRRERERHERNYNRNSYRRWNSYNRNEQDFYGPRGYNEPERRGYGYGPWGGQVPSECLPGALERCGSLVDHRYQTCRSTERVLECIDDRYERCRQYYHPWQVYRYKNMRLGFQRFQENVCRRQENIYAPTYDPRRYNEVDQSNVQQCFDVEKILKCLSRDPKAREMVRKMFF